MTPRLKKLLLLQPSGGWLPKGFTELEYLESSGTQYLLIDEPFTTGSGVYMDVHLTDSRLTQNGYYLYCYNLIFNNYDRLYAGLNGAARYIHNDEYGNHGSLLRAYSTDGRYTFGYNFRNSGQKILITSAETQIRVITAGYVKRSSKFPVFGIWNEYNKSSSARDGSQRLFCLQMTQGDEMTRDMVPVLDAAGTPCLYDRVDKSCVYNAGSGIFGYRVKRTGAASAPMSLRDPYYTAPSGVYARLVAENALEILADTEEISGDGWERFANTAEAYEHFGIVPQEEELLTE